MVNDVQATAPRADVLPIKMDCRFGPAATQVMRRECSDRRRVPNKRRPQCKEPLRDRRRTHRWVAKGSRCKVRRVSRASCAGVVIVLQTYRCSRRNCGSHPLAPEGHWREAGRQIFLSAPRYWDRKKRLSAEKEHLSAERSHPLTRGADVQRSVPKQRIDVPTVLPSLRHMMSHSHAVHFDQALDVDGVVGSRTTGSRLVEWLYLARAGGRAESKGK